jgi:hypothetical protein
MKKLSDYKGEEAIDLWANLVEPISMIMSDKEVKDVFKDKEKTIAEKAKICLKSHKAEIKEILLSVDETEIDGINLVIRFIDILKEIEENEELKVFFQL